MKYILSIFCLFVTISHSTGQSSKLASQYYVTGEYKKAAQLYKKLYTTESYWYPHFSRYIESMLAIEEYDQCLTDIKEMLKKYPKELQLYIIEGNVHERQMNEKKATQAYQKAINGLDGSRQNVLMVTDALKRLRKYDMALDAYLKAESVAKTKGDYAYHIADLYRVKGDKENMIKYYLTTAVKFPNRMNSIQQIFTRELEKEDYSILKPELYTLIQENPDNFKLVEMLQWTFIQEKNYKQALRQARSLTIRQQESGHRIYEVSEIASNDKDYDTAIKGYQSIIDDIGPESPFYFSAKGGILKTKRNRVMDNFNYTEEDVKSLDLEFQQFFNENGINRNTAFIANNYANFLARYVNDVPRAIQLLNKVMTQPNINRQVLATSKLALGDYYLIEGDIWESTLLYSQVDKDHREGILGEQARYKNALLSYFNGDFQWAQAQFDVLKTSTSKLISNDAIDKSVFIMDNMGLDTSDVALKMYTEAELFIYQNKYEEALNKLAELESEFPDHSLIDDIHYGRANIFSKQRKYDLAQEMYQKIIDNHQEEIRCDNAIFELAKLYEGPLEDTNKAMELYEKLFVDFSGSTYAVDARKNFRDLRGDNIQ